MQRTKYAEWVSANEQLESPQTRKARRAEYWYSLELAGLVIFWDPFALHVANVVYFVFVSVNCFYYLICFGGSMTMADSLTTMSQYLNFFGLIMIAVFTLGVFQWKKRELIRYMTISADGFYNYNDGLASTHEIDIWKNESLKLKKIVLVVVPSYFCLIAASVMLGSTVDLMFSYVDTHNETIINGIYQGTPVKMWFLHPIDSEIVRWITIFSQVILSGTTAMVIGCSVLILFIGGQHLIIQLKILNMACREMDRRADKLYEKATGKKPPTALTERTTNQELMGFYKFCLKQVVEHHHITMQYVSDYQSLINWPGGIVVINGSVVVAMSMLSIIQGGGQPSLLVTSFLLIIAEVASIFIFCEVGETVRNLCDELFDSMYSFEWMNCSTDVKKFILIMKIGMKKPFTMMAGSLTPIDRNMFSSMMNTAYSYMNLMLASGSNDDD